MQTLAHSVAANDSLTDKLAGFLQRPLPAVVLVTAVVGALAYGSVYLLKHKTGWKFPYDQGDN